MRRAYAYHRAIGHPLHRAVLFAILDTLHLH